jgi:hypothetical protein
VAASTSGAGQRAPHLTAQAQEVVDIERAAEALADGDLVGADRGGQAAVAVHVWRGAGGGRGARGEVHRGRGRRRLCSIQAPRTQLGCAGPALPPSLLRPPPPKFLPLPT